MRFLGIAARLEPTIAGVQHRSMWPGLIAAMSIAGEYKNIPSWVADWPHCCVFEADTYDGLRWSAMVLKALKSQQNAPFHRIVWPGLYSGWDVLKLLRYIKIACDVLRCIFQHVGICAPDVGISQPFIIRFSNGSQHCDAYIIGFHVICE